GPGGLLRRVETPVADVGGCCSPGGGGRSRLRRLRLIGPLPYRCNTSFPFWGFSPGIGDGCPMPSVSTVIGLPTLGEDSIWLWPRRPEHGQRWGQRVQDRGREPTAPTSPLWATTRFPHRVGRVPLRRSHPLTLHLSASELDEEVPGAVPSGHSRALMGAPPPPRPTPLRAFPVKGRTQPHIEIGARAPLSVPHQIPVGQGHHSTGFHRSEERRVGQESSAGRGPEQDKKKRQK